VRFLSSLSGKATDPVLSHTQVIPQSLASRPYNAPGNYEAAVRRGFDASVWVSRAIRVRAENHAKVPIVVRDLDRDKGPVKDGHPLALLLNRHPNPNDSAIEWRQTLVTQLLLAPRGVFVEVVRDRVGGVLALYLLPPQSTAPIPDVRTGVSGFVVEVSGAQKVTLPPENVVWIKIPHPSDPYRSYTPLEAAGVSVEIDLYARLSSRSAMLNDQRGAGLLILDAEMDADDLEEWKLRSLPKPGPQGAGQLGILGGTKAEYVDLTASAADAQYVESRGLAKDEILEAFGTPESVLGKAADRTYENAGVELEGYWSETMAPMNALIGAAFDRLLDPADEDYVGFDYSGISALQRVENERRAQALDEVKAYVRPANEYRKLIGEDPLPGLDTIYLPVTMVPLDDAGDAPVPVKERDLGDLKDLDIEPTVSTNGKHAEVSA
jgi:HK97 family phage portal protein